MKYPNNITTADTAWARIHHGRSLNPDTRREATRAKRWEHAEL